MTITIITGPFYGPPPAPCGAVERLWQDLAEQFVAAGHTVTIVCRRSPGQSSDEQINGVRYLRHTCIHRTSRFTLNLIKDFLYALRTLRFLPRADILVTNVVFTPILAGWFRKKAGKIVVAVHRFPKNQLWLYYKAARFAVVSTAIKNEIARQLPSRADITRIFPNPINTAIFLPPPTPRTFVGLKTVIYTGRVHPEKGIHLLIDAFAQLRQSIRAIRLQIVGPINIKEGGGGDGYLEQLKQKAAALPIEFVGPIYDRQKLATMLQSAHCYTYPTIAPLGEALPVAPIEAMATGLVPVVSDMSCFDDYLFDGQTGFRFDYQSPDASARLAKVILRVLSDADLAQRIGSNAADLAGRLSNRRVADLYLQDFQELLQTNG